MEGPHPWDAYRAKSPSSPVPVGRAAITRSGSREEGADIIAVDLCRDFETIGYPMATPDDLKETALPA
jgi:hypothetical protein